MTDKVGVHSRPGKLAGNGGPALTMSPVRASPAVNAIAGSACTIKAGQRASAGRKEPLRHRRRRTQYSRGGTGLMTREALPQRREPGLRTVMGAVAALLAATACFVGCLTEISALGREHRAPTAALIAAAAGFAVAAVALVRVAIRLEHRFRSAQPAARATPSAVHQTPVRRPGNSPATRIAGIAIIVGAIVALTTLAVHLHSQAVRSSYTQHHGLVRTATVEAVQSVSHDTSHDSWTTYDYDVALAVPAGSVTRTVAHDPTRDFQRLDRGDTIRVLVNPQQLDYAELPGIPVQSSSWFTAPLALAVVFLALAALITAEEIRHRRLRSAGMRSRSGPPPAGPLAIAATSDPAESPQQAVRALRAAGRLADAAELVDQLGPYGVADDDTSTVSLGAAVLEAYGDQLAATDRSAADDAYRRAADSQRSFAGAATSGGEGAARMAAADQIEAKRRT